MLQAGRLVLLHRGVYAVGHAQLRPEGFRLAAVLACGEGTVLSHRTAAAAWGLLPSARATAEVTLPPSQSKGRALPGLTVHRARLPDSDRTELDGVPVTSVARTLVDVASTGSRRLTARAVDAALVEQVYDQRAVDEMLRRGRSRRGVAVLREILERRHPDAHRTRSELEALALEALDEAGLPRPRLNRWLSPPDVEADLLWEEARLVVELDGRRYHAHRPRRDAERDALLVAAGYRVRRFGWGDVVAGAFIPEVHRELDEWRIRHRMRP
jgi:very-short-patch-repair endonuclease